MNRKERKNQGGQTGDTVVVLRRRAKQLLDDQGEQFIGVFLRAADELEMRRKAALPGGDERLAVEAIADNRRLRNTLVHIYNQIRARKPAGWPDQVMQAAERTLAAVRPFGEGRRIMAIQIGKDEPRESVEAIVAELLDAHYRGKDGQETSSEETSAGEAAGLELEDSGAGESRDVERSGSESGPADQ